MSSRVTVLDEDPQTISAFPPMIIVNPREKIEAAQVDVSEIQLPNKVKCLKTQLVPYAIESPPLPTPMLPLSITWSPHPLYFALEDKPIEAKLWIWNSSDRSIYFNYCGLWHDTARLGASWKVNPRTRIWLPPGLKAELIIRATPRELSPVPHADAFLQIAASHMRDRVTGYFSIPIEVHFLNYFMPPGQESTFHQQYHAEQTPLFKHFGKPWVLQQFCFCF